jgi:hypothetical protein
MKQAEQQDPAAQKARNARKEKRQARKDQASEVKEKKKLLDAILSAPHTSEHIPDGVDVSKAVACFDMAWNSNMRINHHVETSSMISMTETLHDFGKHTDSDETASDDKAGKKAGKSASEDKDGKGRGKKMKTHKLTIGPMPWDVCMRIKARLCFEVACEERQVNETDYFLESFTAVPTQQQQLNRMHIVLEELIYNGFFMRDTKGVDTQKSFVKNIKDKMSIDLSFSHYETEQKEHSKTQSRSSKRANLVGS